MGSGEWRQITARYGQRLTLRREGGEREVKAFFQPVDEKAPGERPTPLGTAPAGKYLYLGPVEEPLEDVSELVWEGRSFRVIRHREFSVGEEPVYRWAIAEELDGVST